MKNMATITCPECGKKLHITDSRRDFAFCEYCGAKIEIAPFVRNAAEPSEPAEPAEKRDCGHTAADVAYRLVDAFASPFEERRTKKRAEEERKQREAEAAERKKQEQQAREEADARAYAEYRSAQNEKYARQVGKSVAKAINYYRANTKKCLIAGGLVLVLLISAGVSSSNSKQHAQKQAAHSAELARLEEERVANSHLAMGEVMMPVISDYSDYRNVVKQLKDAGFINVTAEGKGDMILGIFETENDVIEVTVDGAPDFKEETWYPMDIPIVILYHSFYSSNSSSDSSQETAVAETTEEELCYGAESSEYSECYWVMPSSGIVRYFLKAPDSYAAGITGRITSGNAKSGYKVHFNYLNGWDETITVTDDGLQVTRSDGTDGSYTIPRTSDFIQSSYDGPVSDIPEGVDMNQYVEEQMAAYGIEASSDTTEQSSSTASKSTSGEEDTALGYVMNTGSYRVYYYIDFANHEVYYFAHGNGDETAMRAKIVSGSFKDGITIHFSYDRGWDEQISFSKYDMSLTDGNGYTYSFSKAPTGAVKQILSTKTVIK